MTEPARKPSRKAQSRRLEMLQGAVTCFQEKGLRETTIADICARLGISPGHLYYYFPSKDALYAAIFELHQAADAVILARIGARDDALDVLLTADFRCFAENVPMLDIDRATLLECHAEAVRNPGLAKVVQARFAATREAVRKILRDAQARGQLRTDADVDSLERMIGLGLAGLPIISLLDADYDHADYSGTLAAMIAPYRT